MPKPRKSRRQQTLYREGVAPTPEWSQRFDTEVIEAPRIDGYDGGNARTVKRQSRALSWCRWGWVSEDQCKALITWETMAAAARYDHLRSCLDMTPVGYGGGETPAKVAMARDRFDALSKLLCAEPGHQAAWTVWEWLEADTHPNYAEEYDLPKAEAQRWAVSRIRGVANALMGYLK